MVGPYRSVSVLPSRVAVTRDGELRLEEGPAGVTIEVGGQLRLSVEGERGEWIRRKGRGKVKRRDLLLDRRRLWVVRAYPTGDFALWHETESGWVERLAGVRPQPLLEADALRAMRSLDRVAADAARLLARFSGGAQRATELGRGGHRILLVETPESLRVYARPLFHERLRLAIEVASDGAVTLYGAKRVVRGTLSSRYDMSISSDRILFADRRDRSIGQLWLPWISTEDRAELVRRFGDQFDRERDLSLLAAASTPSARHPASARPVQMPAFLPRPLPYSGRR